VLYSAPSVTEGYPPSNPGLRYYDLQEGSLAVLEATTLWLNLTQANAEWAPRWQLEYAAREAYGMQDLSAASWEGAVGAWAGGGAAWGAFVGYSQKLYEDTPACERSCKAAWLGWINGSQVDD
jgi:hypothetical protein